MGKIYDGRNLLDKNIMDDVSISGNTLTTESGTDTSSLMYQWGSITDFSPWTQSEILTHVDNQKKLVNHL
ncbi:MAG: hypothetical protein M0R03_17635 [Novosphingobium sp.]|nr:hypothetical protein [Novosphingobium sp.]